MDCEIGAVGETSVSESDHTIGLDPLLSEGVDWIVRRRSGRFTSADQVELALWRARSPGHDAAYREAEVIGSMMREVGREMLDERPAGVVVPLPRPVLSRRVVLTGAVAASLAGVIAVGRSFDLIPRIDEPPPDYVTAIGERRAIQLAQGLTLELDAKTSIALDRSATNRLELLEGRTEVLAQLAPDARVTVVAGNGEVSAHAARFDVRLDERGVCVTCLDGDVTVSQGADYAALGASQQLVYSDTEFGRPVLIEPNMVTAWKNGRLIFQQTPLSEVVREVNRYRKGQVVIASSSVGRRPVNGIFFTDRIEDAVGQIQQITGAHASRLPGNVVVLS